MKPKKSHEELPEDLSNEDKYPPIAEDGSRRSALLKILDDLTRVEVTVSRIPDVPPEITKMVSFTLCRLRNRIVKTFPEDFPELWTLWNRSGRGDRRLPFGTTYSRP